ncbi:MAG TPA: tail fiber protein [Candidatus Elarobacter sp.]|jgi:microcystin-dependent protein|nr:tail fiber protein [Candidatus Elarobacter sp.]
MSSPFVAEIRAFPFNFAPKGWALCAGQLLPISQNTALFSLLGTYYGGDGKSNFALPNLQGNVAVHTDQYAGGGQYPLGSESGTDYVTLLTSEMPSHTHTVQCDTNALNTTVANPQNALPGNTSPNKIYSATTTPSATMNPAMISVAGGSQPHNNMQPYLCLNFCIALQGIFPPRS